MNIRRLTSLTAFVSFILVVITSVVLYITPHGRVAYWSDWRFLSLSKTQWTDIHINLGILMLMALLLHLYYNWKPILKYLQNAAKKLTFFTREMNGALLLAFVFTAGTLLGIPPFSTVLDFAESIKEDLSKKYGEPPYGHAELSSLNVFAKKMGWEPQAVLKALQESGLQAASLDQTLLEIAQDNGRTPQAVYQVLEKELAPETASTLAGGLPDSPPPGFGQLTLETVAQTYGISLEGMVAALAKEGVEAAPDKSLKSIATNAGKNPYDLYEILKAGATGKNE